MKGPRSSRTRASQRKVKLVTSPDGRQQAEVPARITHTHAPHALRAHTHTPINGRFLACSVIRSPSSLASCRVYMAGSEHTLPRYGSCTAQ
jgi:hypothetical protein